MGAVATAAAQPFMEPLNNCCKFVLNDMECQSNCGFKDSPCGCKLVTHQVEVHEEEIT